jgi:hypothetical protein
MLRTSSLLIDKEARLGGKLICFTCTHTHYNNSADNWRLRYKSLSLHDPVWGNHLAYLPFPPNVRLLLQPSYIRLQIITLSVAHLYTVRPTCQLVRDLHRCSKAQCVVVLHARPNQDRFRRNHAQHHRHSRERDQAQVRSRSRRVSYGSWTSQDAEAF